jgi:hypothetical protein
MSQLHSFLNVLQPNELAKCKKVRLIGRERQVFDYILSYKQRELPDVPEICKVVDITSSHYYKICSIVLDKLYAGIIPSKGYELLFFLNRKGLYSHFTHEILMQEKELLDATADKKILENFYLNVFKLLQRVSSKNINEEIILEYGAKYLSSKSGKDDHDKYFVRCSFLATQLILLKVTKKDVKTSKNIHNELLEIEKSLKGTKNFNAKYQLNRALSIYYNHCVAEPDKAIMCLDENLKIINSNQAYFNQEETVLTKCRIAEMLYMNSKFEEAFISYKELFEKNEEILGNDFYHNAKFAQLAIILGKFDFAKELITNRFSLFIENKQSGSGTMGCLLFAKLYLFNDPENIANKYIQTAKKLISKSFYIQYEFEVRILENIYFILKKDYKTAISLLKKNLKFMNSKGLNLKNSEIIYVFVLLQAIMKPAFQTKKISTRLQTKLDLLQQSYAAIYGKLLLKVIETVKQHHLA